MYLSVEYGTKSINFSLTYKNRKTLEINVEPPDIVHVIAPSGVSEQEVLSKVRSKAKWIVQKLYALKDMKYIPIPKEFVSGESFMYLGRNYSLQLEFLPGLKLPKVQLYQGKFHVTTPTYDEEAINSAMETWFRNKASEKISQRVKYYCEKLGKSPSRVRVKHQEKRWASCTSKNELLFNWRCIMAPSPILDYIVVHEMCHMVEKNHSKRFWDKVASILPDFERRKDWLKNNGVRMDL